MKSRLFYRLFGGCLTIVTLTVAILGILISDVLKTEMTARIEQDLLAHARIVSLMLPEDIEKGVFALARQSGTRVTLIDRTGRVMGDSERNVHELDNHLNRLPQCYRKTTIQVMSRKSRTKLGTAEPSPLLVPLLGVCPRNAAERKATSQCGASPQVSAGSPSA